MPRKLLKDTCQLAAEILDGKHDADLHFIAQAAQARKKRLFRVNTQVRFVGTGDAKVEGKTGTIVKVNPRTISVGVGEIVFDDWDTEHRAPRFSGGEYNVDPALLELA